jgi:hypothetical protein
VAWVERVVVLERVRSRRSPAFPYDYNIESVLGLRLFVESKALRGRSKQEYLRQVRKLGIRHPERSLKQISEWNGVRSPDPLARQGKPASFDVEPSGSGLADVLPRLSSARLLGLGHVAPARHGLPPRRTLPCPIGKHFQNANTLHCRPGD